MAAAPASSTMRASTGAFFSLSFHPARIFTVTGMDTAFAIAAITSAAWEGSRIRLQPALCFAIFGTGQPMLTSTMSAPSCSTTRAAEAIFSGSPPKICTEIGRSFSVYSASSSVRSIPRTRPSELTISVTTSPQPPWRFTRRRNAVSVMPAMGATAKGDESSIFLIFTASSRLHIRRIHFDADAPPDEIDRQDETRLRSLPRQAPDNAFERAMRDFDERAGLDRRARIEGQRALDQGPDALDFVIRHGRRLAVERHDRHDATALQDGESRRRIEPREDIAGEQGHLDPLLAILPAAPSRHRRQEGRDLLLV